MNKAFDKVVEELQMEMKASSGYSAERVSAFSRAIEIVKQEAEQYNNGWISCSERLPNQDGEFTDVLITCESIADGVFVQSAEFYIAADGEPVFDALYHFERVLAWQPLPQPYQQKGEMNG